MTRAFALLCLVLSTPALAQRAPLVQPYVSVDEPRFALTHVRVIDGTGAAARDDQTIVVDTGRITAVGARVDIPKGSRVLDLHGKTVIPGLVGMHEHLFWPARPVVGLTTRDESFFVPQPYSFPRLYLAAGVTTARTAGSVSPFTDLAVKRQIDAGTVPGPRLDVTGPYIEGTISPFTQFPRSADAAAVTRLVDYWAQQGVTSFKVYNYVTRAQLDAAIADAHRRGLKVAGHLCSIGFREAAAAGIDSLEHGLLADSEFVPGKKPELCPPQGIFSVAAIDLASPPVQAMIHDLVAHHVAVTSTLAIFDAALGGRVDPRGLPLAVAESRAAIEAYHATASKLGLMLPGLLDKELAFERAFVAAGGPPHGRLRSHRRRHRARRLRRSAQPRAARLGRLHAGRGHPHRHRQRRALPRPRRHRHHRRRQTRRPRRHRRQSGAQHRRHREGRDRLQGRARLRLPEADRVRARQRRPALDD